MNYLKGNDDLKNHDKNDNFGIFTLKSVTTFFLL